MAIQTTLLKNEIKLQLSKAKITSDNLKQVKKNEKDKFIDMKLLEINDTCLRWGLSKNIITKEELTSNSFSTKNDDELTEYILLLTGVGVVGSTLVYNATLSTTGGFLGFFTTTVATTTTLMATAIPIALAGAGIYGVIKYEENKQNEKLINHFEKEKNKILNFYLNKIDNLELLENKNGTN